MVIKHHLPYIKNFLSDFPSFFAQYSDILPQLKEIKHKS